MAARDNSTLYAILGLLNHESMSGYDIRLRFRSRLAYFWDAGFGQIYPGLKRLVRNGWATRAAAPTRKAGRNKFLFSITPGGRKALKKWLAGPAAPEKVRYEILLKLFFGSLAAPEANMGKLRDFRIRSAATLGLFRRFEKELQSNLTASPDHRFFLMTVRFGIRIHEAYLKWCGETIDGFRIPSSRRGVPS